METSCLIINEDENENTNYGTQKGYILGTDFGSTSLIVKVYDLNCVIASTSAKVPYILCEGGGVEIDPEGIFNLFVDTVKSLLDVNNIKPNDIKSSGFSFQRSTFMLWDKETGTPRCNLISWQDTRCDSVVQECNQSYMKRTINLIGSVGYTLFRRNIFLLMKVLQFDTTHTSMKLMWLLKNDPKLFEDVNLGNVLYGTIDTWIIWKLTHGKKHITDYSCAGGTAIYDPYLCEWSHNITRLFGIQHYMFPTVVDSHGFLTNIEPDIFGATIPINSSVADTQAGLFGLNCFNPGQPCCLMGTGCFLSINTGSYVHTSLAGLYPQIGWRDGGDLVYTCEGKITGMAPSIEWAKDIGLFDDVSLMSDIAKSAVDSNGVFFVPGLSGLCAPHNDPNACCGLIGIKRNTTKAQMVRAILEGIAFRYFELYQVALNETKIPFKPPMKVSGGLSNNDFLMDLICSLTNCEIERVDDCDISLTGAVYLAGLGAHIWTSKEALRKIIVSTKSFIPDLSIREQYRETYNQWLEAVKRCKKWYAD